MLPKVTKIKVALLSMLQFCVIEGKATFIYDGPENLPEFKALAMIESGNNGKAKGKLGEISRYQIKPSVWKTFSQFPFLPEFYIPKETSVLVAVKHWNANVECFYISNNYKPSNMQIYAMWNIGYYKFRDKYKFSVDKLPHNIRNRCVRFKNLVELYHSNN
jgi:hypothetical protein